MLLCPGVSWCIDILLSFASCYVCHQLTPGDIDVQHAANGTDDEHVSVTYYQDGKAKKVKARSVVVAIGGWVARNIVSDLPTSIENAYSQFHHSPILVVNVALRNWRFLEELGIAAGRWFDGWRRTPWPEPAADLPEVAKPGFWLTTVGWRRHYRQIDPAEVPCRA